MNDFKQHLDFAEDLAKAAAFDDIYFRIWGKQIAEIKTVSYEEDPELQLKGVDKIVRLESGKEIYIDEKLRHKWYKDICIEEYSDYDAKKGGWLADGKLTDWVAYGVVEAGVVFFMPYPILKATVRTHYRKYLDTYGRKFAENKTYRTSFIPVPVKVLGEDMRRQMTNKVAFA
jgi:hypothetical protein